MVSLKWLHFSAYHCVFFPANSIVHILKGRFDTCFLIFEKNVKMCVYIRQIKKPVLIDYTLEKYMQQKKLAGRSFFPKLGLAGSGACKTWQEFEGSSL